LTETNKSEKQMKIYFLKLKKVEKFLEGFRPVSKKTDVENCQLTKSSGWVGGIKSSFMECLQQ
jgi:hypothetical protein